MNGNEQITLQDLKKTVDSNFKTMQEHVKLEDKRWDKIEPIVTAWHDQEVIKQFVLSILHGIVVVLGAFATIGSIAFVIWNLFFRQK